MKQLIITLIIPSILVYIVCAFIEGTFSIPQMNNDVKSTVVAFGVLLSLIIGLILYSPENKKL